MDSSPLIDLLPCKKKKMAEVGLVVTDSLAFLSLLFQSCGDLCMNGKAAGRAVARPFANGALARNTIGGTCARKYILCLYTMAGHPGGCGLCDVLGFVP